MSFEHRAALREAVNDARPDSDTGNRRTSWTADELLAFKFPEPRWAVPGLIAEGCTVLAGSPKVGKSWLALNLAVAIALGGRALGSFDVEAGDVLYLVLEDTGRRLQTRLSTILAGESAPRRLHLELVWSRLDAGGAADLEEWLVLHPDCRLVIVDVFTKVRPHLGRGEAIYDADYAAVTMLKDLADRYGVAVVIVHHTRKEVSEDFLASVSGSFGISGSADAILVLDKKRGADGAVLKVTGRDIEEAEYPVRFASEIGTWNVTDVPVAAYKLGTDERRRIFDAVLEEPGIGPKRIAELAGVPHDSVKHLVRKMVDDGTLDTDGRGAYFQPSEVSERSPRSPVHSADTAGQDLLGSGERGEHGERHFDVLTDLDSGEETWRGEL